MRFLSLEWFVCPAHGKFTPEETELASLRRDRNEMAQRVRELRREVQRLTAERDDFEASDRGIADALVELAKSYGITSLDWNTCPTELVIRIIDHLDEEAEKRNAALVARLQWLIARDTIGEPVNGVHHYSLHEDDIAEIRQLLAAEAAKGGE